MLAIVSAAVKVWGLTTPEPQPCATLGRAIEPSIAPTRSWIAHVETR